MTTVVWIIIGVIVFALLAEFCLIAPDKLFFWRNKKKK